VRPTRFKTTMAKRNDLVERDSLTKAKYESPSVSNKAIATLMSRAASDLAALSKGKKVPDGKGAFGESRELLVFEMARASEIAHDSLAIATRAHERLLAMFRDDIREVKIEDLLESMTLCFYGFVLGNYEDEDFRYVYRYSLYSCNEHHSVESWLQKALVFLALFEDLSGRELMQEILEWMRFLGTPIWTPAVLSEPCSEFGVDISPVLTQEDFRLVDAIRRHPQYMSEAISRKSYREVRQATKDWLPDVLSSKLLSVYRSHAYKESQERITTGMPVRTALETVRAVFEETGFVSDGGATLPVRLQDLPTPPPAEEVNPAIFELIPQKLRMELLSAVAYSTKTTSIEIIFIGGPRIGRSGIVIKTDTGGILLDYGLSVANQKIPEWVPELQMIDTVLVSHAHLDHVGGLPALYETYTGKWCSTALTGVISKALLEDALNVGAPHGSRKDDMWDVISAYHESNIDKVTKNHVRLEVGKSSEVGPGIVVTPIDASHIPGSVSYLIDIEGVRILYTGDFNTDQSILFPGSSLPTDANVVILDGTYWGREDFSRPRASEIITDVVNKHGPIVIPTFAVGRSQEILMTLEALGITQRKNVIVTGLAERVTKLVGLQGHWQVMKKNKTVLDKDDILVSGGGMMGGGLARQHFREHRDNPEAGVILCGYLAPRTPGWNVVNGYEPHKCRVEYARLSAHSSASNLERYVRSCSGMKIMVHTPVDVPPEGVVIPDYRTRIRIPI